MCIRDRAKEGVVTTPSGLQYKIITKGNGAVPADSSKVKVNYKGTPVSYTHLIHGTEVGILLVGQMYRA